MADVGAGIDVDRRHRLGLIENQVAAGFQRDIAIERAPDLLLDTVQVEYRATPLVQLDSDSDIGQESRREFAHGLVVLFGINQDALDITGDNVAQDPERQRQVLVHDGLDRRCRTALANHVPEFHRVLEIVDQRLPVDAFGDRSDNGATGQVVLRHDVLDQCAQAIPLLLVLDAGRHADRLAVRQQHQVPRRQSYESCQSCTLVAKRIFDNLHNDIVTFTDQVPNIWNLLGAIVRTVAGDVRRVQEGGSLQPDIDERRLHARQYSQHATFEDVADRAAPHRALDIDLLQYAVLQQRCTHLAGRHVDQYFFFQGFVGHVITTR